MNLTKMIVLCDLFLLRGSVGLNLGILVRVDCSGGRILLIPKRQKTLGIISRLSLSLSIERNTPAMKRVCIFRFDRHRSSELLSGKRPQSISLFTTLSSGLSVQRKAPVVERILPIRSDG